MNEFKIGDLVWWVSSSHAETYIVTILRQVEIVSKNERDCGLVSVKFGQTKFDNVSEKDLYRTKQMALSIPAHPKELVTTDTEHDDINHPAHYNSGAAHCECGRRIECIDVSRHMDFNLGNALKYIWRSKYKNGAEDIKKAIWYLNDHLKTLSTESVDKPVNK